MFRFLCVSFTFSTARRGHIPAEVRTRDDIAAAYERLATERVQAAIVEQSTMLYNATKELAQAATPSRLLCVPKTSSGLIW
jgi:hypothetical protein